MTAVSIIASRTTAKAKAVAERWGIPTVHDTPPALIADPSIEILDIAYPPDQQPDLIRQARKQPHIKAILAHYLGVPLDLFQRIEISPASVSIVKVERYGPEVLLVNGFVEDELLVRDS